MIKTLFSNASAKVMLNGILSQLIILERFIRQGFPIDPLLYALAVDAFSYLLADAQLKPLVKGISLPKTSKELLYGQFGDVTNVIIQVDQNNLDHLFLHLKIFCQASSSSIGFINCLYYYQATSEVPSWLSQFEWKWYSLARYFDFLLYLLVLEFHLDLAPRSSTNQSEIDLLEYKGPFLCQRKTGGSKDPFPMHIFFLYFLLLSNSTYKVIISLIYNFLWSRSATHKGITKVK